MNPVLQVEGARKRFGSIQALDGAVLDVRRGEILALLGPNGAGKTTLVRAITGRVRLDAGQIHLFGESTEESRRVSRLRLGVVPQEIALYDLLTPRENLEGFGRFHALGTRTLRDRVSWALEWTGLAPREKDLVKGFSGGMKRRLNIACGILHRPEIVLLDEPTVGVDPQSRERIWEMLAGLRAEGASLLLTTHQLDAAEARSDRIAILDRGRTIASGTLDELVGEIVGAGPRVSLTIDTPLPNEPEGAEVGDGGRTLRFELRDVSRDLPPILEELRRAGRRIDGIQVEKPSLRTVFLQLTGRELRE